MSLDGQPEWPQDHAPAVEHGIMQAVGSGTVQPLLVSIDQLSSLPVQAILDALAQRSKDELGQNFQDISKIGEKLGKRLVPIENDETITQRCMRCHSIHARCDGKRPCGRCLSRNMEADCAYPSDHDFEHQRKQPRARQREEMSGVEAVDEGVTGELVSLGQSAKAPSQHQLQADGLTQMPARRRQKRPSNLRSTRPIRRDGVTASGDVLCPHGIEKRYCVDTGCVANGGGKAICQHGRRRRCCKEPECKNETERKRNDMEARRCVHGRQKRLCREGDCLKDFSAASKAYRELTQQRRTENIEPIIKHPTAIALKSMRKVCENTECGQAAMFGLKSDGRRVACRMHKDEEHIDLSKAICAVDGCSRTARFGELGERPTACVQHRRTELVDCSTKRCQHVDPTLDADSVGAICFTGANYGDPHERKRYFCREHKRPTDVQLATKYKHGVDKGPQDPVDEQALESNSDDTGDGEMEVERVEQHAGGGGVEQHAEGGGVVAGGGGVGGCAVGVVQEVHVEHVIVQHVYAADKVHTIVMSGMDCGVQVHNGAMEDSAMQEGLVSAHVIGVDADGVAASMGEAHGTGGVEAAGLVHPLTIQDSLDSTQRGLS